MQAPYRLDTPEAISGMMAADLPGIGTGYDAMLTVARRLELTIPPAMTRALTMVAKDFTVPVRNASMEYEIVREKPVDIGSVGNFALAEKEIAWVEEVARSESMPQFLMSCPAIVQRLCLVDPEPETIVHKYLSARAVRKFLRGEIICYSKSRRTKHLDRDRFRRLLAACALFDLRNEDVLGPLKAPAGTHNRSDIQNALAEFYFARLPSSIAELAFMDTKVIRRRVFAKVAKLLTRGIQRSNLFGLFPANLKYRDLVPTLQRMERLFQRMNVASEKKQAFHDYVLSIIGSMARVREVYRELFVGKDLEELYRIYAPRTGWRIVERKIRAPIRTETLELYPTKDYLDLFRGHISKDCVGISLGEVQLKVPNFFNVRIFRNAKWIGNIYMLDFTESHGVLLIDRVQMPRSVKARYVNFFDDLKDALSQL
ncbi:MAG TPA: hypothetical protein ENO08_05380, partial [Candidatus Eisenbacteria bacterium]|nr:hypothetical protein [Candidatus Eisenbacteria bacterium]